jgi:hypothetical protein
MVTRMVVEQSRTLSIEGLVYVNSSGWTFETAR